MEAGFPRLFLFRPAYIYPVEPRREPAVSYRLLRAVYPAFQALFPRLVIRSDDLGGAMVDISVQHVAKPETVVLENRDIQAFVEQAKPYRPS
jgi:hypothetical protein